MLHVVYVIVCTGWDRHAQMAWLSIQSLRLHEPRCRVTLVTDESSEGHVRHAGLRLADSADEVVVVPSPQSDRRLRAFHIKTLFRRHVTGDVLYLDGDTLVVRPVGDVGRIDADVAAALDFNHDAEWFPPQLEAPYRRAGFQYPLPYYFNSGVLFMRDTAATRALSEEWSRRWAILVGEGLPGDQEALVSALYASPVRWTRLPKEYNAIVVKRNYRFRDARVLHFFGSPAEQEGTILAHLLRELDRTARFDEAAYTRCLREGHPWGPGYQPWQLWRSRNYLRAIALKARGMFKQH
jgi:hypothetical protein